MRHLLLLGEFAGAVAPDTGAGGPGATRGRLAEAGDSLALIEEMPRAFSRDPTRLREARGIVERLNSGADAAGVVPESFRVLWALFEEALDGCMRSSRGGSGAFLLDLAGFGLPDDARRLADITKDFELSSIDAEETLRCLATGDQP